MVSTALLSAWAAWSDPAAPIGGAEALSLADLYDAAAPALDSHEAALRRCQIDVDRDRHAALETALRELVRARLLTNRDAGDAVGVLITTAVLIDGWFVSGMLALPPLRWRTQRLDSLCWAGGQRL